jgi:hypothetical protein
MECRLFIIPLVAHYLLKKVTDSAILHATFFKKVTDSAILHAPFFFNFLKVSLHHATCFGQYRYHQVFV